MAMYDWDGNGRKDFGDDFIEYQIYKDVTGDDGSNILGEGLKLLRGVVIFLLFVAFIGWLGSDTDSGTKSTRYSYNRSSYSTGSRSSYTGSRSSYSGYSGYSSSYGSSYGSTTSSRTSSEKVDNWEYIKKKYDLDDDKYGADAYDDPEDFYEDYYDDFDDEDEAEDYWDEYH